ncbi:hypothetical protein HK098_006869, partial [Nowakowskiella sp. JEL0407]
YKVVVAMDTSKPSKTAVQHACRLVSHMKAGEYKLHFVYVLGLNPKTTFPYIDQLEKSYNLELTEKAQKEVEECKTWLVENAAPSCEYVFMEIKGEGDVGPLLIEYCDEAQIDLLIVGCRGLGPLGRAVFGSVSEYCLHHAHFPVMVVKDDASK